MLPALAVCVLLMSAGATAASEGNPASEEVRVLAGELLDWVASAAGLPRPALPEIRFVSAQRLSRMFRGDGDESTVLHVEALYDRVRRRIWLTRSWNPDDPVDRARLLHELVHHMQVTNGVHALCPAELEAQAYELQLRWLSEQGVADPYAAVGVDPMTVELLSECF